MFFHSASLRGFDRPSRPRRAHLRQPEIQNFGVASVRYEDIGRLDVTVHDALDVGRIESVRNLDGKRQQRLQFQRSIADRVLQGLALQELHGDKRLTVLLTNVIYRADVGMVQCGS